MDEHRQLTDEMVNQFREGCRLLREMSTTEYWQMKSARWRRFNAIDKSFWSLLDPGGPSVFDSKLDGPCTWGLAADWAVAAAWQKALIEASDEVPRDFGEHPRTRRPR
jgi:hypothetical protein